MTDWITDRLPTQTDADIDGDVLIPGEYNDECFVEWATVHDGEPWQQPDRYEQIKDNTIEDRWITSRQPLESDGNKDGAVHVRKYPNKSWGVNIHWSYVGPGVPWEHTRDYEGVIEPIPFEALPEDIPEEPVLEKNESTPSRTFFSIKRTYVNGHFFDAIASDGTAWWRYADGLGSNTYWIRHPPLPQD
jgi:hypothetical protein